MEALHITVWSSGVKYPPGPPCRLIKTKVLKTLTPRWCLHFNIPSLGRTQAFFNILLLPCLGAISPESLYSLYLPIYCLTRLHSNVTVGKVTSLSAWKRNWNLWNETWTVSLTTVNGYFLFFFTEKAGLHIVRTIISLVLCFSGSLVCICTITDGLLFPD